MTYYVFPENLDVDELLRASPPKPIPNFRFNKEHLKSILSLVLTLPFDNPKANIRYGYVPLKGRRLRLRFRGYQHYLRYLVDVGVLETDNRYVPGKKCRGYRYTEKYISKPVLVVVKNRGVTWDEPVDKIKKKLYRPLIKGLNGPIRVLYSEALAFMKSEFDKVNKNGESDVETQVMSQYRCARGLAAIRRIQDGTMKWKADDTIKRFYTPITNMPREFRKFIHYDGKRLACIDLKNSQPFILLAILRKEFWTNDNTSKIVNINQILKFNTSNYFHSTYNSYHNLSNSNTSYSKANMVDSFDDPEFRAEVEEYARLTSAGLLYQVLEDDQEDVFGMKILGGKHFKKDLLKGFFSDNRIIAEDQVPAKFSFRRRFPKIYRFIAALKRKEKKWFAHLLQTIESYMFLTRLSRRLIDEGFVVYTIHDSVVTTADRTEEAIELMEYEIYEMIGYRPTFAFDLWLDPREYLS